MGDELMVAREGQVTTSAIQPRDMGELWKLAGIAASSGLTATKNQEDAFLLMMTGQELGLSVMQSLRAIHVVKGRPVLSADLMAGIVKRSDVCEYLVIKEMEATRCTITTQRRGDPEPTTMTWTMEDANRAGLRGDNWKKYPQAMLKARCMAQICRAVYPDVVAGLYDPDELGPEPQRQTTQEPEPDRVVAQLVEEPADLEPTDHSQDPDWQKAMTRWHAIAGGTELSKEEIAAHKAWVKDRMGVERSKHMTAKHWRQAGDRINKEGANAVDWMRERMIVEEEAA